LLTVKDNQRALKKEIIRLHEKYASKYPELVDIHSTLDSEHGRLEEREISVLNVEQSLKFSFPNVNQVAALKRRRENLKSGKVEESTHYLITSLTREQADAERLLEPNPLLILLIVVCLGCCILQSENKV